MKKTLFIAILALVTLVAQAKVTWNVKAGFGFSQCVGMNDEGDASGKFVWKIGAGAEIPLKGEFMLMPSLEYANKGAKWQYMEDKETINFDYLQIPVLVAYRIPVKASNFILKAGPYFAYAVNASVTSSLTDSSISGKDFFSMGAKRFDVGIDVGIDWEFHKFVLGVEYERGFSKMVKSEEFKINNSAAYLTVGYKF